MDTIRLATIEEIEEIAATSDLVPGSVVVAFGPDRAVIRNVFEIDPVVCPNPKRKQWLMMNLETWLRLNGIPQYYFNVDANELDWQDTIKSWGAEQVSQFPELRFKKSLL